MKFNNIHTHQACNKKENCLQNIIIDEKIPEIQPKTFYSAGIHPWYLENFDKKKKILEKTLKNPYCVAVGECGLDFHPKNLAKYNKQIQLDAFEFQIKMAEKFKLPLIIHCVKCFDELIQIKKNHKNSDIPWIIHGFAKNKEIAKTLIQNGFYISFGPDLIKNPKNQEALQVVPMDKLFFETDDKNINIQEIYVEASVLLEIPVSILKRKIAENFTMTFKTYNLEF